MRPFLSYCTFYFFPIITTLCPNVRKEIKLYLIQILVIYPMDYFDTMGLCEIF